MILVEDTIISEDLLDECFTCDLKKCKGLCCVEGDAGAPLTSEEAKYLQSLYQSITKYLPKQNIRAINKQGVYVKDFEGELTTPLVENKQCAYAVFDKDNIAICAIEKAYNNGEISFLKPVSCHLYPVRISPNNGYDALNYHKWSVCKDGIKTGEKLNVPVYSFVKDALIRKYGKKWYAKLVACIKNER